MRESRKCKLFYAQVLSAAPSTIDIVYSNMTYLLCAIVSSNSHPQPLRPRHDNVARYINRHRRDFNPPTVVSPLRIQYIIIIIKIFRLS